MKLGKARKRGQICYVVISSNSLLPTVNKLDGTEGMNWYFRVFVLEL